MLDLITDRTASNASRLKALIAKGWASMTSAEKAEWLTEMKGGYNASDLNRVGEAVQYLSDTLAGYGYPITVSTKTDWTEDDIPTVTQLTAYLSNVATLKAGFHGAGTLPSTTDFMTVTEANQIEQLLQEIETNINNMAAAFWYSGEIYSGEA